MLDDKIFSSQNPVYITFIELTLSKEKVLVKLSYL